MDDRNEFQISALITDQMLSLAIIDFEKDRLYPRHSLLS